jgi:hypothetical protein
MPLSRLAFPGSFPEESEVEATITSGADSRWCIVGANSRRTLADCRRLIDSRRRQFLDVAAQPGYSPC